MKLKMKALTLQAAALALAALFANQAGAVPVLCEDPTVNHMYVDSAYVSGCLGGGVGNINGNPGTDAFLLGEGAGLGLVGIGDAEFAQAGEIGAFWFDVGLWDLYSNIAVGFKFGTGNKPDEWFVYSLNSLVSAGTWEFVNVFDRGGGLSHVELYGTPSRSVPEPGTLALLGLGLLGVGLARRRKAH